MLVVLILFIRYYYTGTISHGKMRFDLALLAPGN